jgi:transposase
MLDRDTRAAILKLHAEGHGKRTIARLLKVSRNSVREVLATGEVEVPIERPSRLLPHLDRIRELYASCRGNEVRVHEELLAEGIEVGYSTLTRFCRRHELGGTKKRPAGRYDFAPGVEMQHDTSPHKVEVGGRMMTVQCASLVLCFSRKLYAQVYPRWSRFEARLFLSQAICWLGGAARRCMLDNSTVIIGHGTGKDAVPAPEMKAFSDRFGFAFVAHAVGDANRSGKVERPFDYIENNFYAGRTFADLADLNAQLHDWCERDYHRPRKRLGAKPVELFVAELPTLKALPPYVPEVYDLHSRRVDIEGFVNLHTNRYSVDARHIGHRLEIRETADKVRIFDGHRLLEEHDKLAYGARKRQTLPKHKGQAYRVRGPRPMTEHERVLRTQGPELVELVERLRRHHGGRAVKAMRRLHRIWTEYPTEAVRGAVSAALEYRLLDLRRIERLVLQQIAGDFFALPTNQQEDKDG